LKYKILVHFMRSQLAKPRQHGSSIRAFSLIDLLVVVVIVGILAALLLPSLASARSKGKQAACVSDLRQHLNHSPKRGTPAQSSALRLPSRSALKMPAAYFLKYFATASPRECTCSFP
jgi:Tfp pilus assembly protein PilE